MKKIIALIGVVCANMLVAQHISFIAEQSAHYGGHGLKSEHYWDSVRVSEGQQMHTMSPTQPLQVCTLNKRVFGWHPYWNGTVYNNYQWNLLSDLCYFDYAVSPNTGQNTNSSFAWSTSGAVTAAINNGVDVHICATLFSSHSTFLASNTAQNTFISNIISLLQSRGGKGVNIDFEGMGSADRAPFTAFMMNLSNQLHTAIPGSELSVALYAVDWSNVFDIPALTPYVDLFIIMGYDYYWSGSTTAGPTDPLYNFSTSYNYTLSRSITFYLKQGMPSAKLLLGLPYYGREWETTSLTVPSSTTGNFTSSRIYSVVRDNINGYYTNTQWEPNSFTPYYAFTVNAANRQCFIDNGYSMKKRFDVVNQRGLGGIGIWALGYDDGYTDFWQAIEDKFSDCAVVPCSDTIWDMGGPNRNYYDSENFSYTISPANAAMVNLNFSQFDVELNYDTLWIYNGPSTSSPLIGAYTGTNSPGTITSSGPHLTLRFKSDNNTVRPGWSAIWNCIIDATPPVTTISVNPGWQTQNFPAMFTDTDPNNGTGIEKSFYQVADYNGTAWRANGTRGFFNDEFTGTTIHPSWTSVSGTWNVNASGKLEQSDEAANNTNIYTQVTSNLSNRYLYHWQGKIAGTGNNRRAGLHFFCDNPSLTNRGNSYFIWFRLDQGTLEFYKVVNDVFTLQQSVSCPLSPNTWYDFKVSYDRILGTVEVYVNNSFISSWTDPQPYATGDYVSFRSGNSNWQIDDFRVYRSRYPNQATTINVGNCPGCDIRFENTSPAAPSAILRSINKDNAHNLSGVVSQQVNVDWTAPQLPLFLHDGPAADIDTTYNLSLIAGNWTAAADSNSGVANYLFAVGTTPGDSDFIAWQNNALSLSFSQSAVLIPGQWYYTSLKATNGAGLTSTVMISDGQLAEISTFVNGLSNPQMLVYPVPADQFLSISFAEMPEIVEVFDVSGKRLYASQEQSLSYHIQTKEWTNGIYVIRVYHNGKAAQYKIIVAH
ncbi:MAG: hypothetical protein Fur0041_07660 [Bacteroidia bacterium]